MIKSPEDLPADFGKVNGEDHPDDVITRGERERCAKLVEAMIDMTPYKDKPWARMALAVAGRAIRRGRHLTEREKLLNLADAMEEPDVEVDCTEAAAKIRQIAERA